MDGGPPERHNSVMILKTLGEEKWSRGIMGYGRRWSVETAFLMAYFIISNEKPFKKPFFNGIS